MPSIFGCVSIKGKAISATRIASLPGAQHKSEKLTRISSPQFECGAWHSAELPDSEVAYVDGDLACVCSAEIVGIDEIAAQLKQECSDIRVQGTASVLAHLVRHRGQAAFSLLHGAFTCFIWDRGQLWVASDRFGQKRISYSVTPDAFEFASRPGWLGRNKQLNSKAIYQYMSLAFVPTPQTIFMDVHKLPCGHYLHWNCESWQQYSAGDICYSENLTGTEEQLAYALKMQLRGAVENTISKLDRQTTGCYLSGGTDSSTVLGMVTDVWGSAPPSFTIGFDDEQYSELDYARTAAKHFGSKLYEYVVRADDGWRALPQLLRAFDEPFGNPSAIGGYICAEYAASHGIQTMLAGDGGDELFGGNERYAKDVIFGKISPFAKVILQSSLFRSLFSLSANSAGPARLHNILKRAALNNPERFYLEDCLTASLNCDLLSPDVCQIAHEDEPLEIMRQYFDAAQTTSELNRLLLVDMKLTIGDNDLVKVRETAAACGVEVRFPMLDNLLVDFSGRIPANLKVKGLQKRYLFKKALKDFLPQSIITKKKHGFGVPVSLWFRSDSRFRQLLTDTLHDVRTRQRGLFQQARLDAILDEHMRGFRDWGQLLWAILMLELSIREHTHGD